MIDWLIDYLRFYVPLKNISLIWRRHHCRWRAAKFRPMLGAQGLWAGRDLYRATPAVTRGLGFSGLIRRTAPFSRLLRHTRGCGGSILTRILTGLQGNEKWAKVKLRQNIQTKVIEFCLERLLQPLRNRFPNLSWNFIDVLIFKIICVYFLRTRKHSTQIGKWALHLRGLKHIFNLLNPSLKCVTVCYIM
jgi:hypothetical protein